MTTQKSRRGRPLGSEYYNDDPILLGIALRRTITPRISVRKALRDVLDRRPSEAEIRRIQGKYQKRGPLFVEQAQQIRQHKAALVQPGRRRTLSTMFPRAIEQMRFRHLATIHDLPGLVRMLDANPAIARAQALADHPSVRLARSLSESPAMRRILAPQQDPRLQRLRAQQEALDRAYPALRAARARFADVPARP